MLLNFSRQTFWAVFVPLTLVAGLFWLSEIRGYRAEMSLLVLPKTEFGKGAAANLVALARELPFATAVYETDPSLESPFTGKTIGERTALWQDTTTVTTSGRSDLIQVSVRAAESDEALTLVKAVAAELVRTGSRYYNQKTDIDIRIIEEPATIPSFTAWPRFFLFTLGTALTFTFLFFLIHELINRLFPKKATSFSGSAEYTISPDTFKPRVPTYWNHNDRSVATEVALPPVTEFPERFTPEEASEETTFVDQNDFPIETVSEPEAGEEALTPVIPAAEDSPEILIEQPEIARDEVENLAHVSVFEPLSTESEVVRHQYVEHAAAPDNLPVFDGPLTPLQGAQARLLKLDIDANAEALSADEAVEEINHTPKTHEPTPDEFKRRLNDLLSGKM